MFREQRGGLHERGQPGRVDCGVRTPSFSKVQRAPGNRDRQSMSESSGGENGGRRQPPNTGGRESRPRQPAKPGRRPKGAVRPAGAAGGRGPIRIRQLGGDNFELVQPQGVVEAELDYEEGIELWKAGDPESARDALRYALSAYHDNIWIHVALGQIALDEFHDPALARGHFGYAFELAHRALPQGFKGRLPRDRPSNRPLYEAMDGLIQCLEALGLRADVESLRALASRLAIGSP
jgi:hypothetical protein